MLILGIGLRTATSPETALAGALELTQAPAPAADPEGLLSLTSADTLEGRQLSLGLSLQHATGLMQLGGGEDGRPPPLISSRVTTGLVAGFAPLDGLQLSLGLPFIVDQSVDAAQASALGLSPRDLGLGDMHLEMRGRLLRRGARFPAYGGPLVLALHGTVDLPTGDAGGLLGTGVATLGAGATLEAGLGHTRLLTRLGYRHPLAGADLPWTLSPTVDAHLGTALTLQPWTWELLIEAGGSLPIGSGQALEQAPLEILASIRRRSIRGFTVTVGGGIGLISGSAPAPRLQLTLHQQIPANRVDRDGDGVVDARDRCLTHPEDRDGFEDQDGCEDEDNDRDRLPDRADQCPDAAEDRDRFQDEDGCPDPDNDGDGFADGSDRCPEAPEDRDGYLDEDGCPDPDNDDDGLKDGADKCPNEAEDKDGFEDEDGCADRDNDRDTIPDSADRCPNELEDADGFEDLDGCPEPDNDRDGLPDLEDLCPDQAEDASEPLLQEGCPADIRYIFRGDRWRLLEEVQFSATDDEVLPRSRGVLDGLAAELLRGTPRATFLVECYTDNQGSEQWNLKRSADRARTVALYLIQQGIPAEQLSWVGYGEARPVASNASEQGRARNRRVEIVVAAP